MSITNNRIRSAYRMGRAAKLNEQLATPTLEERIRKAQGEPQGEEWEFEVPTIQARILDGSIWGFEGSVGRMAMAAITSGACFLPSCWADGADRPLDENTAREFVRVLKTSIRDYYGNVIPYREMLKPGTKGTLEHSARFYGIKVP